MVLRHGYFTLEERAPITGLFATFKKVKNVINVKRIAPFHAVKANWGLEARFHSFSLGR